MFVVESEIHILQSVTYVEHPYKICRLIQPGHAPNYLEEADGCHVRPVLLDPAQSQPLVLTEIILRLHVLGENTTIT